MRNLSCSKVILTKTTTVWITSNVKLLYLLPILSKFKVRSKISSPTQTCGRYIFWSPVTFPKHDLNMRKYPYFKNPWECVIEELPTFKWKNNLQCDHMLKWEYQEKNVIECYECPPNDECAQLKSDANGYLLSERTFLKEKYVKSHTHFASRH